MKPLHQLLVRCVRASALAAAAAVLSLPTLASPDHDHGDEAPVASGEASPRITAHSDLFELVGIVEHDRVTLYLDRYASNEPVRGAKVEIEAGEARGIAAEQEDGTYVFEHEQFEKEGPLSVTFTIAAGEDTDLLAGDVDIGHHDDHGEARAASAPHEPTATQLAVVAAAALALLIALVFTIQRLRRRAPAAL